MVKQKPIYTEIRIKHNTQEDKANFEKCLDEALKEKGYSNRIEWVKEKYRELINSSKEK